MYGSSSGVLRTSGDFDVSPPLVDDTHCQTDPVILRDTAQQVDPIITRDMGLQVEHINCATALATSSFRDGVYHAATLTGAFANLLTRLVRICDKQYVQLQEVLTTEWLKEFMRQYERMYQLEKKDTREAFYYTRLLQPLASVLVERIKNHSKRQTKIYEIIQVKLD